MSTYGSDVDSNKPQTSNIADTTNIHYTGEATGRSRVVNQNNYIAIPGYNTTADSIRKEMGKLEEINT